MGTGGNGIPSEWVFCIYSASASIFSFRTQWLRGRQLLQRFLGSPRRFSDDTGGHLGAGTRCNDARSGLVIGTSPVIGSSPVTGTGRSARSVASLSAAFSLE